MRSPQRTFTKLTFYSLYEIILKYKPKRININLSAEITVTLLVSRTSVYDCALKLGKLEILAK